MRRRSPRTARVLVAGSLAVLSISSPAAAEEIDASPCPPSGHLVLVVTERRELWLCRDGRPAALFAVALGRSGVGKRRRGDGRTPLGTYALGAPRPSARSRTSCASGGPAS